MTEDALFNCWECQAGIARGETYYQIEDGTCICEKCITDYITEDQIIVDGD